MSPLSWIMLFLLVILGVFLGGIFLMLLIKGIVKKNPDSLKKACIPLLIYIMVVAVVVGADYINRVRFEKLPNLSVSGNKITVLNDGSGSKGSSSCYILLSDEVLREVDQPHYNHHAAKKFGYTFEGVTPGKEVLVVVKYDFGRFAYGDIYCITVDDNRKITVEQNTHIKSEEMSIGELAEYLVGRYSFPDSAVSTFR